MGWGERGPSVFGRAWGFLLAGASLVLLAPTAHAADPPPVEAYGRLPQIDHPQLSPDGTMVAYISPLNGRRCVRIDHFNRPQEARALCSGNYEVQWFAWKSNTHLLIKSSTPSETVKEGHIAATFTNPFSFFAADVTTGQPIELAAMSPLVDILENDADHILISVFGQSEMNARSPETSTMDATSLSVRLPDIVRLDINDGSRIPIQINDGTENEYETDDKGNICYAAHIRQSNDIKITWNDATPNVNVETMGEYRENDTVPFSPIKTPDGLSDADTWPLGFADQPGAMYIKSSRETGFSAIYLYDVRKGNILARYQAPAGYDVDDLIKLHGHVVGYTYTTDEEQQIFTDPTLKHEAELIQKTMPDLHTFLVDRTPDGQHDLILAAGGSQPGSYYLLEHSTDGRKATMQAIGDVRPWIPDDWVAPTKPIVYAARDGLQIHGYLTLPPGDPKGPIPFVVLPHGGPAFRDHLSFDYLAQMIASRGFGVLQPNFRGSTGYGNAFEASGFDEWGRKMQDDITDGTKWLIDQHYADPSRICIVGWSYGGYAALMGAIKEPDLYRCAASMAGVTNLQREIDRRSSSSGNSGIVPILRGDTSASTASSPLLNAAQIKIPIFLAHGRRDVTVPVRDTELMERALKRAGKTVTAIYFDEDDHYLLREPDRIRFLTELEKFLKANLSSPAETAAASPGP